MIPLSRKTKQRFLEALQADLKESDPFETDKSGQMFVKFDEINIRNEGKLDAEAVFSYRGKEIYYISLKDARIQDDNILTLSGLTGKMEIYLV